MTTREQDILSWLNRQEKRIKRAVGEDSPEEVRQQERIQYGAVKMLTMLGYILEDDKDAAEWVENKNVGGYWIYKYTGITDTTGRD